MISVDQKNSPPMQGDGKSFPPEENDLAMRVSGFNLRSGYHNDRKEHWRKENDREADMAIQLAMLDGKDPENGQVRLPGQPERRHSDSNISQPGGEGQGPEGQPHGEPDH